jgi:23S rRNA (guanosine2251-2'-O)-methyltransferase
MAWITSRHAIVAALRGAKGSRLYLVGTGGRNRELDQLARRNGVAVSTADSAWLRKRAGEEVRGAALEVDEVLSENAAVDLREWLARTRDDPRVGPILALDHISDPHNLGAILRSAFLMEAGLVIIPTRRSVSGTGDTVLRTSAGASRFVTISYVGNLRSALELCRESGWWIYGADAEGTELSRVAFDRRAVLVLGAEGKGLSALSRKISDEIVTIPAAIVPESGVDSYNVSVAAGILLYAYRSRQPLGTGD